MSVYEQVKQALQYIVAPELKALQIEIKRLDEKVDIAINIRERLVAIETELGLRKKESGKRVELGCLRQRLFRYTANAG